MDNETNNTKIEQIAELRKKQEVLSSDINITQDELDKIPLAIQYNGMIDQSIALKKELTELENDYKAKCVDEYKKTGDKNQLGGAIKIFTTYDVLEESVLSYAIHHSLPHLLKPNMGEFKKFAKIVPLGFVTVVETPKMTLASDLSEFLEE